MTWVFTPTLDEVKNMAREEYNYKDFSTSFSSILHKGYGNLPKIAACYGKSEVLLWSVIQKLEKECLQKREATVTFCDGAQLDLDRMHCQRSFFEKESVLFVRHCEKKPDFWRLLQELSCKSGMDKKIFFFFLDSKLPVKVETELKKLNTFFLKCVEPKPWEMSLYINEKLKEYMLEADSNAVSLLCETLGSNLATVDNEIQKLSLIFSDQGKLIRRVLSREEILSHVGFIREDSVFQLDSFLLEKKLGFASGLIADLLRRGESATAILGVVARHCRIAMKIAAFKKTGLDLSASATTKSLPAGIARKYLQYADTTSIKKITAVLKECQKADLLLKSSKIPPEIILNHVVQLFSHAQAK